MGASSPGASLDARDRPRFGRREWCGAESIGWKDELSVLYCNNCWTTYDCLHETLVGGTRSGRIGLAMTDEPSAGQVWRDEILEAESLPAEGSGGDADDDGQVLEFMRNVLQAIDFKRSSEEQHDDAECSECEADDEEGDAVPEMKGFPDASSSQIARAHIIVIVDTSRSMTIPDVEGPHEGVKLPRIAAVAGTLLNFFAEHVRKGWPHLFSLISFNREAYIHFVKQNAIQAHLLLRKGAYQLMPRYTTRYLTGLASAWSILGQDAGTPHVLFFSDGQPTDDLGKDLSADDLGETVSSAQGMLKASASLRIHAIGFGEGLDFGVLQQLAALGRGVFVESALSLSALNLAFSSVTSTITKTQTVTGRTSQSRSSVTFASEVDKMPGAGGEEQNSETDTSELRFVVFEPPNQSLWGPDRSLSFLCYRRWLTYDGISFQERGARKRECHIVHMRLHPFSEGGTRLVYCFKDTTVLLLHKEAETHARMVAKLSRYTDDWHNSREVVPSYAKILSPRPA